MRARGVLAAACLAGAGTMIVELAAVRLLAPWFGTSSAVWTNVIGVVLLALSVGYLLGARLAVGERPAQRLGVVLLLAGVVVAWLPALSAPVAEAFVPRGVRLDQSPELFTWGSLAAACLLFAPAAGALACVGPLAVELLQRGGVRHAGTAGGRVLFASTLGSLAGTFATTYGLVPHLGCDATFLCAGVLLLLPGAALVLRARRAVVVPLLLLGLAALALSRRSAPVPGDGVVLATEESAYQFVRVVERDGLRYLKVNEGLDSYQSVWSPEPGLLGIGYYYDAFVLPTRWLDRDPLRVFVAGFGAGTVWRVLEGTLAGERALELVGAELDPTVVELAYEHFDLPRDDPRLTVLAGWDGRAALRALAEPCDLIVLDAYANQSEIPAHLSSLEFFAETREALAPGGVLAVNVSGFGFEDPVVSALGHTIARAFERRVLAVRVPSARNVALFAVRDGEPPAPASFAEGDVLLAPLALPGIAHWYDGSGLVLTDDLNPIERLQVRSLRRGAREWSAP